MRKMSLWSVFTLTLCALMMSSCFKKESEALTLIPKESFIVTVFQLEDLQKKADLKSLKLTEILNDDEAAVKKTLLENPQSSGVDFKEVFLAVTSEEKISLAFALKNAADFAKTIEDVLKEESKDTTIETVNGVSFVAMSENETLVWDESKALFVTKNKGEALLQFATPKENSILNHSDFSDFYQNKKEVALWMDNEGYFNLISNSDKMSEPLSIYTPEVKELIKGTYSHINLAFNNGNITMTSRTTPIDKATEMEKRFCLPVDEDLLSFFPAESFYLLTGSLNMPEVLKLIQIPEDVPQEPIEIIRSLKTNVVGSLYEFPEGEGAMPLFAVGVTVTDDKLYNFLISSMSVPPQEKDGYIQFGTNKYQGFLVQKDDKIFFTSSEALIQDFVANKTADKNLTNSVFKGAKNDPSYFYMNLDLDTYPQWIKGAIMILLTPEQMEALNLLKDMESSYDSKTATSTFVLQLKTEENSLAAITKQIDKLIKK